MIQFMVTRLLLAIPQLLGVGGAMFLIIHLVPGDPVIALVGDFPAPPEYIARIRAEFGLDQSLGERFFRYLMALVRGDLGFSFAYRTSVLHLIVERAGATILLTGTALIMGTSFGLLLGISSTRWSFSRLDNIISVISLAGFSIPVFWLGQLLIILFAVHLGWFPSTGMVSLRAPAVGWGRWMDILKHLILPASALSFGYLAITTRLTRTSMLEVLNQDYIRTARSKGVLEYRVLVRHAFPNAMLSVVTLIGYNIGLILSGSVLVETVFGWPGLGRLLYDSLFRRDYPVLMGIFLTVSTAAILANLLTDLTYAFLDPRIRYSDA